MKCITITILVVSFFMFSEGCSSVNRNLDKNVSTPPSGTEQRSRVEFCELVENASNFDGQDVQVSAILITGREYTYLYDPGCANDAHFIWYQFDTDVVGRKLDHIINPENPEYRKFGLIRAKAEFGGTFETKRDKGFGQEYLFNYKLTIQDINNITSVSSVVPYPWPTPLGK